MLKRMYKTYGEYAHKWADRQRSGENISHEYLEKPAMMAALPSLAGKKILCLGCGTGEECRRLKEQGATDITGVDKEEELIKIAQATYPDIQFVAMPMEKLDFLEETFDIVYSSLVMHYSSDWAIPLTQVRNILKPEGIFLFSTHHPIWWSAEKSREKDNFFTRLGASKQGTDKFEIWGDYLNQREITDTWFNEFEVKFFHKPLSEIINEIAISGFQIREFIEPKPIEAAKQKKYNFWAIHQKIPLFMIFKLQK